MIKQPAVQRANSPAELPSWDEIPANAPHLHTPALSYSPAAEDSMRQAYYCSDRVGESEIPESYIPVGILRRRNAESNGAGLEVSMAQKCNVGGFPESEILNLERQGWIRTRTYVYKQNPQWCYVQVYVLPDDVARRPVPQPNRTLQRMLRVVMEKVDQSIDSWEGRGCLADSTATSTKESKTSEDESLWYIFNTLQDPNPRTEGIRDSHGKRAMEELLADPTDGNLDNMGVIGLKTTLYPYQRRSAAAMVQREVQPAQVLDPRLQECTGPTDRKYYYDKVEGSFVSEKRLYSEANGGILSETMGCGKTLICLAVILATRGHLPQIPAQYQESGDPPRQKTASLVDMAAAAANRYALPWKGFFDTLGQGGMSYERCVKACERSLGTYSLPQPASKYSRKGMSFPRPPPQHLRLCSGTLIVVPINLVDHWENEITRHTEGLKVVTIRTSLDPTPPPEELLQFDIVLYSKNRFEREAEGSSKHINALGQKEAYSPLMQLHWLRVIWDEGHGVSRGYKSNLTLVFDRLQVDRRWVASGTPSNGLYGVEVSLASQDTLAVDTDLLETASTLIHDRKETGNAINDELKDLDKLRIIVVDFLKTKPWSNPRGNDQAQWSRYIKTVGEDGKRRKSLSLRATLQSLVVRHRLDVIHQETPLPRLNNKVVHLEPTFYDKMSINLFLFGLAVNAVTSEREDRDYMFHPLNRKHLSVTVNNLRQAGFWWTGSDVDIHGTIDIAVNYLEKNRHRMVPADIETLVEGIEIAEKAVQSDSRRAFVDLQELGIYAQDFPSHARSKWALVSQLSDMEPMLLGISQARMAQEFVTSNLCSYDPAEGLIGAGIKARSELKERMRIGPGNTSETGIARRNDSNNPSPEKVNHRTKSANKPANKPTFTKGVYKTLPAEHALAQTNLVGTASAKLSYLLDRVIELHKAEKILIFYDNPNSAFWIAEGLEVLGIDFRIYANTLKPNQKAEYLTTFWKSEEVRVLLMDLRQASHGLHLANASRVFIVNPIWQPNIESQAIKRAHRIGQTRPVYVETLVLKDTLEEKILKRRKEVPESEMQGTERDLLDDSIMKSIIENEPFIPMTEDEESAGPSYLQNPISLFDRHKLPIPDDAVADDNDDDESKRDIVTVQQSGRQSQTPSQSHPNSPTKRGTKKRKQVTMAATTSTIPNTTIPQIRSDVIPHIDPDTNHTGRTPKRARRGVKHANTEEFVDENGIVMTRTRPARSRRSPAGPAAASAKSNTSHSHSPGNGISGSCGIHSAKSAPAPAPPPPLPPPPPPDSLCVIPSSPPDKSSSVSVLEDMDYEL